VMVKVLRFERLRDWKTLELFEREGRVLEELSHPSVPAYRDFFAHDGAAAFEASKLEVYQGDGKLSLVLVQQLVDGPTIEDRVQGSGPLPPHEVEAVLTLMLETLEYLHGRSPPVVHRDITPRNVILSPLGKPFLVDFGAIQDRLRTERSAGSMGSTTVGTLGFMPLEQMQGSSRPASDLYALGVTMLYAASGVPPLEMPVDDATGKVRVATLARRLSPATQRLLDRMVEPIVGQRIGSAREALSVLQQQAAEPTRDDGAVVRMGLAVGAISLTALLGAAGLLFSLSAPRNAAGPALTPRPTATLAARPSVIPTVAPPPARPGAPAATGNTTPPALAGHVELAFHGKVTAARGVALSPGTTCSLTATASSPRGDSPKVDDLKIACGGQVVYDASASLNGTSMTSYGVGEQPSPERASAFRYALSYSDVGARTGNRAQVTLATQHRTAVAFSETVPIYRVEIAVDALSAERQGLPLLASSVPAFEGVVERAARVETATGPALVRKGAACTVRLAPAFADPASNCRVTVRCGAVTLYGGPTSGIGPCAVADGRPTGFSDLRPTAQGGDPECNVDLGASTAVVADETPRGRYEVRMSLLP
jgi:hypothetical protein